MIKRERELNQLAARYGFGPVKRTGSGHYVTEHLRSRRKAFLSFSPSSSGALQAIEKQLKKASEDR